MKKDLEEFEMFRSSEEKESKELLVSRVPPGASPATPQQQRAGLPPPWLFWGVGVCGCETVEGDFRMMTGFMLHRVSVHFVL